ncbi:hypothetical protein BC834DRAFT_326378 [Gloeopeniophorella convolvens]|nr:hypothetical protein BC834DRAFT_326378 [Gloeopeniophorella convolvens]
MSKPVFYTFEYSIWATPARIAIVELGVDVETKRVNLIEGENFDPEFVKINPNATIPSLTHQGKAYTNTIDVVNHIASLSTKKVAPASAITVEVHEDKIDPNFAFAASRNDEELAKATKGFVNFFTTTRLGGLKKWAATPEAQALNKSWYDGKIAAISGVYALLNGGAPEEAKQGFFARSAQLWDNVKVFYLETIPAAITEGPFIGGAEPGVDDFHVVSWLAHMSFILGAQKAEDGLATLEKTYGPVNPKIKAYWDAFAARPSWAAAYPDGALH